MQEKYREVLGPMSLPNLSAEQSASAHYGLATALQYSAGCLLAASKGCSDEEVKAAEESAVSSARMLLREAVANYMKACSVTGSDSSTLQSSNSQPEKWHNNLTSRLRFEIQ